MIFSAEMDSNFTSSVLSLFRLVMIEGKWHIENNTWARVDMEFLFQCFYFYSVEHEKKNSISTSNHVFFCLSYKHNSLLLRRKADFIN